VTTVSDPLVTRRLLAVYAIFAAVVLLYWPASVALTGLWLDADRTSYTHGFLVMGISLWLVWRDRASFAGANTSALSTSQFLLGSVALLVVALGWQIAYRAGLQLVVEVLMLPLLWLPVPLLLGRNAARATLIPVALLVFAVPLWDVFTSVLQFATVQASQVLLRLAGIPAFFHGNSVEVPGGVFEIEGGCSGLHFFITALFIATLLGELRRDGWRRRVWWLFVAGVLAIVMNWFRVASIIFMGHVTNMQSYLVRESHYGYGWVLFAIALTILFLIERRTPHSELAGGEASAPETTSREGTRVWPGWYAICGLILALPSLVNVVVNARLSSGAPTAQSAVLHEGWSEADVMNSNWQPIQTNADAQQRRRFVRDGFAIESFVAEYREQRVGKKLGGYDNRPQGDADVIESGTLPDPRLAYRIIEQNGQQSVLVLTYRVADRGFANATHAQLWYSWLTLRSFLSPRSEVETWYAPCKPDCDSARSMLVQIFAEEGDRP